MELLQPWHPGNPKEKISTEDELPLKNYKTLKETGESKEATNRGIRT